MLYNNPLNTSKELNKMNLMVIDKIKRDGKNIVQEPIKIGSIYQLESSRKLD